MPQRRQVQERNEQTTKRVGSPYKFGLSTLF
jgi:hypothetical protein